VRRIYYVNRTTDEPVIIDFEKSSLTRKVHNTTQLQGWLYTNKYGAVTQKVKEIIEN